MPPRPDALSTYLTALNRNLASGIATEHTHRPALKTLLESLDPTVDAFNDARHIDVGAPDFTVRRRARATDFPVGWIETKDLSEGLNDWEKSDQIRRYLRLTNFVLTNYLEFRWYVDGKKRLTASLGELSGKRILFAPGEVAVENPVIALLTSFLSETAKDISTPKELAEKMAGLTHNIRNLILGSFDREKEIGKLHKEFQAFRETLIPDLKPDQFADMYAQTIAYGLFAARCQPKTTPEKFSRAHAAELIPKTNPFLRRLFREIAFELDERIEPFVNDLVALLRGANISSVLADFGKRTAKEDPVVHFYEDFLQAYDPKVREMRGVYYTPEPVVSYIVRSVDHLLKTKFNKPLGLADKDVLILDPACGTGTFLYYVIQHIHQTLVAKGQKGQWNSYVSENLLKRVFGFELLMAPYAVAHLKLGLQLQELGYNFESDERLGIFLTNTLEEAIKRSEILFAQYIADEANAASEIKRDKKIMVVLGNPPYSGHSANKGKWITQLVEDYKKDCPELFKPAQAKWLQDDYVKFVRFGEWRISKTGFGILSFVTNDAYLDNPTFRGMRRNLLRTFSDVWVLDLHGSAKKKEKAPDGSKDQNVFDIQQGVAITLFSKEHDRADSAATHRADIWGDRESKYKFLSSSEISTTKWAVFSPSPPLLLFAQQDLRMKEEYEKGWAIPDAMNQGGDPAPGIVTTQDKFAISWSPEEAANKVEKLLCTKSEEEARTIFRLCTQSQWNYDRAMSELASGQWRNQIRPILYRPFDIRWTVYNRNVAVHRRERVMNHLLSGKNIALITSRLTKGESFKHVQITNIIAEVICMSPKTSNNGFVFPLFLDADTSPQAPRNLLLESAGHDRNYRQEPNFNSSFVRDVEQRVQLEFNSSLFRFEKPIRKREFGPYDLFAYIYAMLHSDGYRMRYEEFLRFDFPRVPISKDRDLFLALSEKGRELISLHLMESPKLTQNITRYEQKGDHTVEKVRYVEPNPKAGIKAGRVYINPTQFFEGVPKDVWGFHIGGYQVLQKWLKDRKGRQLSSDDIDHYQKIVVALSETIRLMKEIDDLIPTWPLP